MHKSFAALSMTGLEMHGTWAGNWTRQTANEHEEVMAKAKGKGARKVRHEAPSGKAMTAEEVQVVRTKVANVITKGAVQITERMVQSLQEGGSGTNATSMKFLWELAGLFPNEPAESEEQESLAKILMQRLGFSEDTMPKGDEDGEE